LHHCRNAAAHNGLFDFYSNQPKYPAKWASFEITRSLQSTPLFHSEVEPGLLGPGDAIRLLWDIEQANPQMAV
jgi:hypothetical protein